MGIRALESALYALLFFCHPGQVQLTAAGVRLLDHADTVLELHCEIMMGIREHHSRKTDHLCFGVSPFIHPVCSKLRNARIASPFQRGLEPKHGPTGQLFDELATGTIDAATFLNPTRIWIPVDSCADSNICNTPP